MKKLSKLVTSLALVASSLLAAAPALAHGPVIGMIRAQDVTFSVTHDGETFSVQGTVYHRGSLSGKTLQVAVHGSTYNRQYWDAPTINGHKYSYARYMADEGYAVLAIDKLGAGESDRPDGDSITLDRATFCLKEILSSLRTTSNPLEQSFQKIALVGHSLGSVTSIVEEGAYHSADALVVTGQAIHPHPLPFDPSTLNDLLFSGPYGFMRPSAREYYFYYPLSADPDVIAYDNTFIRDFVPRGEIMTALPLLEDPYASGVQNITEPVLIQLGDQDMYAPASLAPYEPGYYQSAQSVTVQVLHDMGHNFNLHLNNHVGWAQIDAWLGSVL